MNQPVELSLEQKFSLRSFEDQVKAMSHQQAQDFLLMLYQQMLVKDTMFKELLKKSWGIDSNPSSAGDTGF